MLFNCLSRRSVLVNALRMKRFLVEIDTNVPSAAVDRDLISAKKPKMDATPLHTPEGLASLFLGTVNDVKWREFLEPEVEKPYFKRIMQFICRRLNDKEPIRPTVDNVFRAFNIPVFDDIKVVIVGQDPYPGVEDANGLAFAVNPEMKCPASLRNMFANIRGDYPGDWTPDLTLLSWAKQGVLMLNTGLTVKTGAAGSHQKAGWESFTDNALKYLIRQKPDTVLLLMGNHAQKKKTLAKNVVLNPHPSPLSFRLFKNTHPFREVNAKLAELNLQPIDWTLNISD